MTENTWEIIHDFKFRSSGPVTVECVTSGWPIARDKEGLAVRRWGLDRQCFLNSPEQLGCSSPGEGIPYLSSVLNRMLALKMQIRKKLISCNLHRWQNRSHTLLFSHKPICKTVGIRILDLNPTENKKPTSVRLQGSYSRKRFVFGNSGCSASVDGTTAADYSLWLHRDELQRTATQGVRPLHL